MIALHTKLHRAVIPEFELRRDFCTMHLPPKFHHSVFTRLQVIMLINSCTNKQMLLKMSNALRYATTLGKNPPTYCVE